MAKEFKDYDKKFAHLAGSAACKFLHVPTGVVAKIEGWEHHVDGYSQATINKAVYTSDTAEEWQLFRVSLKGLTTREKLYLLDKRYRARDDLKPDEAYLEKVRIDNYIGALIRGGQLSMDLRVMR